MQAASEEEAALTRESKSYSSWLLKEETESARLHSFCLKGHYPSEERHLRGKDDAGEGRFKLEQDPAPTFTWLNDLYIRFINFPSPSLSQGLVSYLLSLDAQCIQMEKRFLLFN